jgi:hypothetical protein
MMYKALKCCFTALIIILHTLTGSAQQAKNQDTRQLKTAQDSLIRLSAQTFSAENNTMRFEKNASFVKKLVATLKIPGAYNFGFDSLQNISIVKSPDNAFKIFSWFVPTDDGSYHFFGAIQMHTADGTLKLFPLVDGTETIKVLDATTDNKNWYGSRYYEIIPIPGAGKQAVYALLGWKGNTKKTSKKVIEILSFENGFPVFGKPVIEGEKGAAPKNRVVFEYNKQNSMTLQLDKKSGMIVLDHLAPYNPEMKGNFEYYASDLSFDAYKPVAGKLKLIENVELKNEPNRQDDFYIDPTRKDIPAVKKF